MFEVMDKWGKGELQKHVNGKSKNSITAKIKLFCNPINFITAPNKDVGKVIFSVVSVGQSVHVGRGSHLTTNYSALGITAQAPPLLYSLHPFTSTTLKTSLYLKPPTTPSAPTTVWQSSIYSFGHYSMAIPLDP